MHLLNIVLINENERLETLVYSYLFKMGQKAVLFCKVSRSLVSCPEPTPLLLKSLSLYIRHSHVNVQLRQEIHGCVRVLQRNETNRMCTYIDRDFV